MLRSAAEEVQKCGARLSSKNHPTVAGEVCWPECATIDYDKPTSREPQSHVEFDPVAIQSSGTYRVCLCVGGFDTDEVFEWGSLSGV